MDVFTNSGLVLFKNWDQIFLLLCVFSLGGGILLLWLRGLLGDSLTLAEYFILSAGGAIFPLFFGIFLTLLLDFIFGVNANFIPICLVLLAGSFLFFYLRIKGKRSFAGIFSSETGIIPALVLILIFIGSIYIRLAFISGLITPLYFDSATHYSIIQGLIAKIETASLATTGSLVSGYYHLGFHAFIASLNLALGIDGKDAMLIFGPILLAIMPLPLFFIIRQETGMDTPGIFTILLAGWGWSMPAYALNWGKYPALISLLAFEFVLCSFYLILRAPTQHRRILVIFLGFCILVSAFIHTRSVILISIAVISMALGLVWHRLPGLIRNIVFGLVCGGVIALISLVQARPVLNLTFQPYRDNGLWMILLVLLLFPFALKEFPAKAFSVTLAGLFLLGSLFIPINQLIPGYDIQTLLDRPYVEMSLFLPLAMMGGLGYAGLTKTLGRLKFFQTSRQLWINPLIIIVLFGAVAVNFTQYRFSPSTCCQFFGEDDAVALSWITNQLPLDSKILIASSDAYILDSPIPSASGSDGGIWIGPLIHRSFATSPSETDFSNPDTLANLCKNKITHIYVGGSEGSFSLLKLQDHSEWYETLLLLPKAQIFKISNCP